MVSKVEIGAALRANMKRGDERGHVGFNLWIATFLDEKGIDSEQTIEVEGASGTNVIPVACLVELMQSAPDHEKRAIKAMMVRLDLLNAPILPYLAHLAKAVAQ